MRLLLFLSIAVCLLPISLTASTEQQEINLRYRSVGEATEEIAKQFGATGTSAVLSTDEKRNTITLRPDDPSAAKIRTLLVAFDQKREQVQVKMKITRKTKATPGMPAQEEILAQPIMFGTPGKPMIVTFEKDGETFQIEVNAEVIKP